MPRRPLRPPSIVSDALPFSLSRAERAGLTRSHLQGKSWVRISRGYYQAVDAKTSVEVARAVLAPRRVPGAVLSGPTAAALWLGEPAGKIPVWLTVPATHRGSRTAEYHVIRTSLEATDHRLYYSLPLTTPVRTAFDCARLLPLPDAVAEVDALLHADLLTRSELTHYVDRHRRLKGLPQARTVVDLCDAAAESRMESRLRVLLVRAGLPRPEVNPTLYREDGSFLARVDLLWRVQRFVVEYEGDHHRERRQYRADLARRYLLQSAGYRVLPVTAIDYYDTPDRTVALVRQELQAA